MPFYKTTSSVGFGSRRLKHDSIVELTENEALSIFKCLECNADGLPREYDGGVEAKFVDVPKEAEPWVEPVWVNAPEVIDISDGVIVPETHIEERNVTENKVTKKKRVRN